MIALTKCPGCQGELRRINHNKSWYEEICFNRCQLDYSQFYKVNFDDNDIGYYTFYTNDFHVYFYIDHFGIKDTIYIYHKVFPEGVGTMPPFIKIPTFDIEWDKLNYYNNKWKIWNLFS